jgi:hypothetical protein
MTNSGSTLKKLREPYGGCPHYQPFPDLTDNIIYTSKQDKDGSPQSLKNLNEMRKNEVLEKN